MSLFLGTQVWGSLRLVEDEATQITCFLLEPRVPAKGGGHIGEWTCSVLEGSVGQGGNAGEHVVEVMGRG